MPRNRFVYAGNRFRNLRTVSIVSKRRRSGGIGSGNDTAECVVASRDSGRAVGIPGIRFIKGICSRQNFLFVAPTVPVGVACPSRGKRPKRSRQSGKDENSRRERQPTPTLLSASVQSLNPAASPKALKKRTYSPSCAQSKAANGKTKSPPYATARGKNRRSRKSALTAFILPADPTKI